MARTTRAQVATIIELDSTLIPDDDALSPFVDVATELVTECCTGDAGPDTAYSDTRLELIERWLTAHFYAVRDPRVVSERAGSVSATYQSSIGLGFDTSHYGQTAMRLDTNGGLARLNNGAKKGGAISGVWLGTELEDIPTD